MSDPLDTIDLSVLTTAPNEFVAGMIVAALQQAGIPARALGVLSSDFRAEAPGGVRVLVRENHRAAAQSLLDDIESTADDIDWSTVDVGDSDP
jgi:hypothetical protein